MRRKRRRAWQDFVAKGYNDLATYNAERRRGLVHTAEYGELMAEIQERFDVERREEARRLGAIVISPALTPPP